MTEENKDLMDEMFTGKETTKPVSVVTDVFDIVLVLDRSGSMASIRDDAIGGVNTFIEEQQKEDGEAYFSIIQFDSVYGDPQTWRQPLVETELLTKDTFIPRGRTALFDAIGKTVAEVRELRAKGEITGKVQFVIQTDGGENSSTEYRTRESVSNVVTQVTEEGWGDFIFLGTNIDAFHEGGSFGFASANTVNYANNAGGLRGASLFAAAATKSFRYGSTEVDLKSRQKLQETIAEGGDIEELYNKIDASFDRGGKGGDGLD